MSKKTEWLAVIGCWLAICGALWLEAGENSVANFIFTVAAIHGAICTTIGGVFGHPVVGLLGGVGVLYGVFVIAIRIL